MSNQYLTFDVTKSNKKQQLIIGRQGDSQLKFVSILFWDGNKNIPYDLTSKTIIFEALKPDDKVVIDENVNIIDAQKGLARYPFDPRVFGTTGTLKQAFFKITSKDGNGNQIADSTLELSIKVLSNDIENGIESESYLSKYDELISEVEKKFDDYAATVQDSIDKAQEIHDQIIEYTNLINSSAVLTKAEFGDIGLIKQPSGVTAVDKLNNEFAQRGTNVRWFGAIGDGVHDDTAAIQQALDTAGTVFFEANRTYLITVPLIVKAKTNLIGNRAEIKYVGPVINDRGMFEVSGDNIYFKQLKFNGNIIEKIQAGEINQHSYTITEHRGLDGIRNTNNTNVSDILIDDCTFTEIQKMGVVINADAGKNLTVRHSKFEYTNRDGSWLVGDNVAFINNVYFNSHDNAVVFDAAFGDADHNNIIIKDNIVYPSTNLMNPVDTTGESYMSGIYIGQNTTRKITDVLIGNNIIKARYQGIALSYVAKNLIVSENVIEMGNNNPKTSTIGIDVSNSTGGIISNNKIRANAYGINGHGSSDEFEIFGNDILSNYIDLSGFKNSIAKSNISRGTSSSANKVSAFIDSQIIGNNFKGVSPYFDSGDGNLYLDNYAGLTYLPGTKIKSGVTLPNNGTNGLSFDATKFFNSFDLTRDLVDIGPNTGAGLEFVVIVLNNRTASPINVSAFTLKNFKSTTVQPGSQLTILAARYNLYTVVSQS